MLGSILLAIVGNQVFPGLTGWWIAYAIFSGLCSLVSIMLAVKKLLD